MPNGQAIVVQAGRQKEASEVKMLLPRNMQTRTAHKIAPGHTPGGGISNSRYPACDGCYDLAPGSTAGSIWNRSSRSVTSSMGSPTTLLKLPLIRSTNLSPMSWMP